MLRQVARRTFSTSTPANFSRITLVGNIGSDIENGQTPTGRHYAKYALAVNAGPDKTNWFRCTAFIDKDISVLNERGGKGARILVEGTPNQVVYEAEGRKHSSLQVLVSRIEVLKPPRRDGESNLPPRPSEAQE
ncbi:Single-stranded DNA-binding protein RIM1, mitochondrial [Neolecta irregularis DAH-3]|uniref:Single-stranded DNA-binding protein RIM1, mitochondrial n=1 Tax=Neolecta irregularis (strain DAH-3) TaxID=1198029 RepID=A0A1U7LP51_NEOID|nr:Single-stranded DNA-binding protein RIM1, mitochondrial [Neolecta irregularis DAH-3]|eukprot:OLL24301.1 Single-stranded DNA-binding protein RIM1, mitochondrial [Neolecta irregularis DAH-3]